MSIDSDNKRNAREMPGVLAALDELIASSASHAKAHDQPYQVYELDNCPELPPVGESRPIMSDTDAIPLDEPLSKNSFPDSVKSNNGTFTILATESNLRHLLNSYGVVAVYDEVAKSQELIFPNKNCLNHDLHNECGIQQLTNQAALNGINKDIVDRLPILMTENTINPVKSWILSTEWNGTSRITALSHSLIVAEADRELSDKIIKTWLIQCVAALERAVIGCRLNHGAVAKYELILTLQGVQGLEKTKWFTRLLPYTLNGEKFSGRYIKDGSNLQLDNKDSVKQNISCWINELGELDATFRKSDIAALKAFCSNQYDIIRLPYAKAE